MSKNIGILSMQKVVNYGSFLQAFGLKKLLENFKYDVFFLDIESGEHLPGLESRKKPLHSRISKLATSFCPGKRSPFNTEEKQFLSKLKQQFHEIFFPILELEKKKPEYFDCVVIGSDEVFHACQKSPWGFSKQLFGEGIPSRRVISYAASFGNTTKESINNFGIGNEIAQSLKGLWSISVRDKNSYELIKHLVHKAPLLHLDPVLVYDYHDYLSPVNENEYIILYAYPGRMSEEEKEQIVDFSNQKQKKLLSIGCFYPWCDEVLFPTTPFEVLSYFNSADYIITDTFHGTIFSLKYNKNFCTFVRDSNRHKITHLLDKLDQNSRIVNESWELDKVLKSAPDYSLTNEIIKSEKRSAVDYLRESLP
ncbi:hypothetical protein CHISP_0443 [Chitinispirillum alkaliphilum]|nr:hypothetical protein CHISP_0443 [Chitinispirillum alkaliphilum]